MTIPPESSAEIDSADATFAKAGLQRGRRLTRAPIPVVRGATVVPRRVAGVVTVPAWRPYRWLVAGFSTRQGGRSTAYSTGNHPEQNLGFTREDDPAWVLENRRRFVTAVAGRAKARIAPELVTIRQCHTGIIRGVERGDLPLLTEDGKALLRGDALFTGDENILLGILTADCVPVLIADTRTHAVAAFHAGWRGTLARIVERGVGTLQREFGSRPKDLIAAIGPAIGACCFAVGDEVRQEFESQFAYAPQLFSEVYDSDPVREKYPMLFLTARAPGHSDLGPQIHMDLWEANRRQLMDAGLKRASISVVGECTACARLEDGRRKYFSHRAEQGFTGRMLSVIGTTG